MDTISSFTICESVRISAYKAGTSRPENNAGGLCRLRRENKNVTKLPPEVNVSILSSDFTISESIFLFLCKSLSIRSYDAKDVSFLHLWVMTFISYFNRLKESPFLQM